MTRHALVGAIRRHGARHAAQVSATNQLGEVVRVVPLRIEILETGSVLEDDQFVLTQWVKRYDDVDGLERGDTVILLRKQKGGEIHWIVTDVLADTPPT